MLAFLALTGFHKMEK